VFVNAPEKIVPPFFLSGNLPRFNMAPGGIDSRKYLPDRSVLAGSIYSLENYKECISPVGIKHILQLGQSFFEVLGFPFYF
jgi:hypothetical protein